MQTRTCSSERALRRCFSARLCAAAVLLSAPRLSALLVRASKTRSPLQCLLFALPSVLPPFPLPALHFTSLHFTSLHFALFCFASVRFTSLHFTSLHFHFTSHHFTSLSSLHFTSLHFTPLHFTSLQFNSPQLNSLHLTSLHFTSFPTTTTMQYGHTSVSVAISLKSFVSRRMIHICTWERIWQRCSGP